MTKKLYWEDAYMKEFKASVKNADAEKITLDQTAFYPTSGGQPSDMGIIIANKEEYRVTDVREENGEVVHVLDREFRHDTGTLIEGRIDWQRRHSLMRYHKTILDCKI